MKSKILQNRVAPTSIYLIALFLLICIGSIDQAQGARINAGSLINLNTIGQQQIGSRNLGIIDKAIAKMQAKDAAEAKVKEDAFLKKQTNYLKATRQAMLLSSPYSNDLEDVKQVMSNLRMGGALPQTQSESYDDQIKKIASQQEEYKDEYEGYGSLSEMIKNKDKIAEKQANAQVVIQNAKSKLTEALSGKKKEIPPPAITPTPKATVAQKTSEKQNIITTQNQNKKEIQPIPQSLSVVELKNQQQQIKFSDNTATQVIDEVQAEQEKNPNDYQAVNLKKEEDDDSSGGFISRYTKKFNTQQQEKEDSNENSNIQTSEEQTEKPKKGIEARFQEQIEQDEADGEKAKEVVRDFQHAMDYDNRSVLDREAERLVQDQNDELELDSEVTGNISIA